jgi:hypothetical protein
MMQIHLIHRKPRSQQYINYNCRGKKAYPQIKLRRVARFETSRVLKTYQNGRISETTIKEPLYFSRIQQIQELFLCTICMNNNQVRNLYRQSLQFLINRIHIKTITNYLKKQIKKKKKNERSPRKVLRLKSSHLGISELRRSDPKRNHE